MKEQKEEKSESTLEEIVERDLMRVYFILYFSSPSNLFNIVITSIISLILSFKLVSVPVSLKLDTLNRKHLRSIYGNEMKTFSNGTLDIVL